MTPQTHDEPREAERLALPSGIPNIDLVHFVVEIDTRGNLPADGHWSVTLADRNMAMQRAPFRSLHAAMNYATRIAALRDWTLPVLDDRQDEEWRRLSGEMRHAEAHAREVDAVYPVGSVIPFSNGPSMIDDDGTTRQFLSGGATIDWKKDEEGVHRCSVCGEDPLVRYEWMDW